MSADTRLSDSDLESLLGEIADEFTDRVNRGEQPDVEAYVAAHPELGDVLRQVLTQLLGMRGTTSRGRSRHRTDAPSATVPRRLGDYVLLRLVGRGGMGLVYEAVQESLNRRVALKILPFADDRDKREIQRFQREAQAAARLHHTHIVTVYGVGQHDGWHYIAMQFVEGRGLDSILAQSREARSGRSTAPIDETVLVPGSSPRPDGGKLSRRDANARTEVHSDISGSEGMQTAGAAGRTTAWTPGADHCRRGARIALHIAEALGYAHRQGVLHRDVKPSNLLIDGLGDVWLTDFGLARVEGSEGLTTPGDVAGTLRYMAPERLSGVSETRSDIYSLGLTLYEILALRPAYGDSDRSHLLRRILQEEPESLRAIDAAIPQDLETIVRKAIEKEPGRRYATADEFAEDLRRFLADLPIRARRVGRIERLAGWCRRNRFEAFLIGAVALLLVVIAAGASVSALMLRTERDTVRAERNNVQEERNIAQKERNIAKKERNTALDHLRDSYLSQAKAQRWSGQAGRRYESLAVLKKAAALRPGLDLRNEAIACLPLVDLTPVRRWTRSPFPVAFDADCERYARVETDGGVSILRVADDVELSRSTSVGAAGVDWFALSPDSRFMSLWRKATGVEVWDVQEQEKIVDIQFSPAIPGHGGLDFSPDSRRMAINVGDGWLRFHEFPSGREERRLPCREPVSIVYHPRATKLALTRWNTTTLDVVDAETLAVIVSIEPTETKHAAWHPDGYHLALACADHKIRIWNTLTRVEEKRLEGLQNVPMSVAFSPGGDLLVSSGWDDTVSLWDPVRARQLVQTPGQMGRLSRNGRLLEYARQSERGLFEIADGHECRTLNSVAEQGSGPWGIDVRRQGRLLATIGDDGARLWDLATRSEIAHLPVGFSRTVLFEPAGDNLLTYGERGLHRWPLALDEARGTLRVGPSQRLKQTQVLRDYTNAQISSDGRRLAAVAGWREAIVVDLASGAETLLTEHPGMAWLALSPDGRLVATGTQHGSGIKIWDANDGLPLQVVAAGHYGMSAFSPDGKWMVTASTADGTTIREVGSWQARHHRAERAISQFSPDGSLVALAFRPHQPNGYIELIEPASGRQLAILTAPDPQPIAAMAFSADGSVLAVACCVAHTVQLWDLRAIRRELAEMDLDWDLPDYPPAPTPVEAVPLQVEVVPGEI